MQVPKSPLACLLAAFVLATSSAPSLGATDDGRDARGDVVSRPLTTDAPPTKAEPARRLGDIIATSASIGTDLVVTSKFRNLAAIGHQQYSWQLLTSEDEFSWSAALFVAPGSNQGKFELIDPIANQPDCGTAVLDRSRRTVTLTIPAACLGNPDWVKVGNGVFFYTATREYSDDARRDGVVRNTGWKFGPKFGPGLH